MSIRFVGLALITWLGSCQYIYGFVLLLPTVTGGATSSKKVSPEEKALKGLAGLASRPIALGAFWYGDEIIVRRMRVVTRVGAATLQWQHDQVTNHRGPAMMPKFVFELVGGGFCERLSDIIKPMTREVLLAFGPSRVVCRPTKLVRVSHPLLLRFLFLLG